MLFLTLVNAHADVRGQRTDLPPELRITKMTGNLRVEIPENRETATGVELPYIRSGSFVRVLSGKAVFATDYQTVIRADPGASFLFSVLPAPLGRPHALRIAAFAGKPAAMDINVGSERFLLGSDGAAITISPSGRRGVMVQAVAGYVEIVPSADRRDNELLELGDYDQTGSALERGAKIRVALAPTAPGLEAAPVRRVFMAIKRQNATTFEARRTQPDAAVAVKRNKKAFKVIENWNPASKELAEIMLEKYGSPDKVGRKQLAWNHKGPWNRTIVYREAGDGDYPPLTDNLRQFINYEMSTEKASAVSQLELGLEYNGKSKELSARSDSEAMNYLALNVAHEVISERMSVPQAREVYDKTLSLAVAGKSSPSMEGLRFKLFSE